MSGARVSHVASLFATSFHAISHAALAPAAAPLLVRHSVYVTVRRSRHPRRAADHNVRTEVSRRRPHRDGRLTGAGALALIGVSREPSAGAASAGGLPGGGVRPTRRRRRAAGTTVQGGALLFPTGAAGRFAPAPTLETDVAIAVTGIIVRAQVTQRFVNPTDRWLEGMYVFPLPETAGVDHLAMYVGPRVIEGQIREREAARRIYEAAKANGRKASLVEQERPNIFTTSVANIGPGETVDVLIEYQDTVPFDGGEFILRFPLVVAPRYIPGRRRTRTSPPKRRRRRPAWPAGRCRPTRCRTRTASPRRSPPGNGQSGAPERRARSRLRAQVALQPDACHHRRRRRRLVQLVTLADETVPADRDFVLIWAPADRRAAAGDAVRRGRSTATPTGC